MLTRSRLQMILPPEDCLHPERVALVTTVVLGDIGEHGSIISLCTYMYVWTTFHPRLNLFVSENVNGQVGGSEIRRPSSPKLECMCLVLGEGEWRGWQKRRGGGFRGGEEGKDTSGSLNK